MSRYKWRIYADVNIEQHVVDYLRDEGMDVLSVPEDPTLKRHQDDLFHFRQARKLRRYLLTRDNDFWENDRDYPLSLSPGILVLASHGANESQQLPSFLRFLFKQYGGGFPSVRLEGVKVRLSAEEIAIKNIDAEAGRPTTEHWKIRDLI